MGFYGKNVSLHDHTSIFFEKIWINSKGVIFADTNINIGRNGRAYGAKIGWKMGFYGKNMFLHVQT